MSDKMILMFNSLWGLIKKHSAPEDTDAYWSAFIADADVFCQIFEGTEVEDLARNLCINIIEHCEKIAKMK